jgi:hypothetical protein
MLETVRLYAYDHLRESGCVEAMRIATWRIFYSSRDRSTCSVKISALA